MTSNGNPAKVIEFNPFQPLLEPTQQAMEAKGWRIKILPLIQHVSMPCSFYSFRLFVDLHFSVVTKAQGPVNLGPKTSSRSQSRLGHSLLERHGDFYFSQPVVKCFEN